MQINSFFAKFRSLTLQYPSSMWAVLGDMLQYLITGLLIHHFVLLNDLVELFVKRGPIATKLTSALRTSMLFLFDYVFGSASDTVGVLDFEINTPQGSMVVAFWSKQIQHYFYSLSSPLAVYLDSGCEFSD